MSKYKFKNRKFPKDFKKIVDYIYKTKGIDVLLGHDTLFNGHFTRQIIIHHNYDLTHNGLYELLHSCGYVYQPPLISNLNIHKRFIREIKAWDMGLEIAKLLNISIDNIEYRTKQSKDFLKKFTIKS